jgi:hypothetical protein
MSNVTTAAKPAEKPARAEKQHTAKPGSFRGAEFARVRIDHVMEAGVPFEEVFKPGYWTNVFNMLARNIATGQGDRAGAFIDCGTEDHAFYAKLYVRAVTATGLIVQCIGPTIHPKTGRAWPVDLSTGLPWTGGAPLESDMFDVKWNVGKRGFDIIRKSDNQVIADGGSFPTRELAAEWIRKTTKAAA